MVNLSYIEIFMYSKKILPLQNDIQIDFNFAASEELNLRIAFEILLSSSGIFISFGIPTSRISPASCRMVVKSFLISCLGVIGWDETSNIYRRHFIELS